MPASEEIPHPVRAVETLDLGGENWLLHRPGTGETYPARVPGCVHLDLVRAGVIPTLDWRDNEATQQWIDGEDWVYSRRFSLELGTLTAHRIELVCDGLDTLATVSINGAPVLEADNMFRVWRVDVLSLLRPGENKLEIAFHSTLPTIAQGQAQRRLREWNIYFDRHAGRGYVRKMACSYGWDWGPVAATAGIWKNICLERVRSARWQNVHIRQQHTPGSVVLQIGWESEGSGTGRFSLLRRGRLIAETSAAAVDGHAELYVAEPELWWPVDLGPQALYEFRATLTGADGATDVWERRIGVRSLRLVREPDASGETFFFEVNGRAIFCKGSNWVPHRILLPEITRSALRRLLEDAAGAHMNMLRVWGGGIYESDDFYDLCDELGILVWQDFAFACGMYPSWDEKFLANVEAEASDNVRRLRHHACLALWCGNNELEGDFAGTAAYPWDVYGALFDELLPAVCARLDPDTPYWPGSPHTPVGLRENSSDDGSGDAHHWSVFFGRKPFEHQRKWRCRFLSEYGFQSFPELRTIESFTLPEERTLTSRIIDYHQRSEVGNQTIFSYLLEWFQPAHEFADVLVLTQLTQALCVRYGAEHLRRLQPHCGGALYWQINDVWPCASWSSIDSFGRWKALHYDARRFFAPVLVSIEENLHTSRARIHVSNQLPADAALELRWQITDTDGAVLLENASSLTVPSQTGRYIADLDASPFLGRYHPHDLMIWAWASHGGQVVSRNWAPLSRPKHLSLSRPGLRTRIDERPEGTFVHVACDRPAPYVVLSVPGVDTWFDDNFFHLHPGEPRLLRLRRGATVASLRQNMRIQCLADWFPARPPESRLPLRADGYVLQRKR